MKTTHSTIAYAAALALLWGQPVLLQAQEAALAAAAQPAAAAPAEAQAAVPAAAPAPAEAQAADPAAAPVQVEAQAATPAAAPDATATTPAAPAAPVPVLPGTAVQEPVPVLPAAEEPPAAAEATAEEQDEETTNVTGSVEIDTTDEEAIPGASASKSASGGNLISVSLDDVEMVDVVKMFTRISGANIIATPSNLQGRVTVNLTDVEWQPALVSILKMHGLGLVEETPGSGVYSIVPKPAGAPEPLLVETFFLRYASVSNVFPVVNGMVTAPGGVSSFPARNALVVRSTSANLGEVKKIILSIDTLREQVYIESKFLELNDNAIKDLGINWQALQNYSVGVAGMRWNLQENRNWTDQRQTGNEKWDNRQHQDDLNRMYDINGEPYEETTREYFEDPPESGNYGFRDVITPTRNVSDTIDKGQNLSEDINTAYQKTASDVRTAVLSAADFRVVMSALKQMDGVTVVSNPKIVVANEESALIHIGQTERPFVSSVTAGQQGIAPVVTYNPGEPVKFGVELTVTPTVNTESNITVRIVPRLTRLLRNAVAPNGQTYPIIAEKRIQTTFCLESGKTAAIGGLTETSDHDTTTKIPLLGSIPIIGKFLFSHTHTEKSQQETIIFVTVGLARPNVMRSDTGLPEDTELAKRHMMRQNANRKLINKQLEEMETKLEKVTDQKAQKTKSRLLGR